MLYNVTKVYVLNNQVLYVDEGEISRDSKNYNQLDVITNVSGFSVELAFKLPSGIFSDRIGMLQQSGTVTVPSGITGLQSVAGQQWSVYTTFINDAVLSAITSTTSQTLEFSVRFSNQITNLLIFDELEDFPTTGQGDKVYQAEDTSKFYVWDGDDYEEKTSNQADDLIINEGQVYTTEPSSLSLQGTIDGDPVVLDPAWYQTRIAVSFNNLVSLYNEINNAITDSTTGLAQKVTKSGDTMTGALTFSNADGTRLVMGNNDITTDGSVNATTFNNGDNSSDAVKFSNFATLFAVTPATPTGGQTWIDTTAAALANKFAGTLSETQLNNLYLRRDGTTSMGGNLNVGGNEITNVGNIDGVDVSQLKTDFDSHTHDFDTDITNKPTTISGYGITDAYTKTEVNDDFMDQATYVDSNDKIKLSKLPDAAKSQTYVQTSNEAKPTENVLAGDKLYETDTGDSYIYDGDDWVIMADADWENVNLDWSNITGTPTTVDGYGITDTYTKNEVNPQKVDPEDSESTIPDLDTTGELDGRYYTESEVDSALDDKEDSINIGNRTYTENHVVTNEESITASIDALDVETERLNDDKAEAVHTHDISDVNNLQTELNGKEPTFNKNTAFNKDFGNTAGTVAEGDDARLSDARTPLSHTHDIADVTGLQDELDDKIDDSEKGQADGVAELDSNGKVPIDQLPFALDDVLQGYYDSNTDAFYEEDTFETEIPADEGRRQIIY